SEILVLLSELYLPNPVSHSSINDGGNIISESTKRTPSDDDFSSPIFLARLRFTPVSISFAPSVIATSEVPSALNRSTTITDLGPWLWLLTDSRQRANVTPEL